MEHLFNLPERTIERLSEYRRTLLRDLAQGVTHIYSHELASIHCITAVQVRRDLMLIGFSSSTKKGYDVDELIEFISKILDSETPINVAVVGMGHLGRAITNYFRNKRDKLQIVVSFDNNPEKVGATIAGTPCVSVANLEAELEKHKISIILLTIPPSGLDDVTAKIKNSHVRSVVNFTGKPLTSLEGSGIRVEDYDIITILEKVAFYSKQDSSLPKDSK